MWVVQPFSARKHHYVAFVLYSRKNLDNPGHARRRSLSVRSLEGTHTAKDAQGAHSGLGATTGRR
jgi:hypothetical protein